MEKPDWDSLNIEESLLYAINNACSSIQEAEVTHTVESEQELLKLIEIEKITKTEEI